MTPFGGLSRLRPENGIFDPDSWGLRQDMPFAGPKLIPAITPRRCEIL
jgi:hypothetical protein